jgi:hypothetical protein
LGYRLADRISARLEGYYYRSQDPYDFGLMKSFSAGGGLEFALFSHLQLTSNAYYQWQRTDETFLDNYNFERIIAYLGMQFVWPAPERTN